MLAIRVGVTTDRVFMHSRNTPQRLDDGTSIATMPHREVIFYITKQDATSTPTGSAPFLTPEVEDAKDHPGGGCKPA
eukprot:15745197-Heterocapsa_arctica.AAC.1